MLGMQNFCAERSRRGFISFFGMYMHPDEVAAFNHLWCKDELKPDKAKEELNPNFRTFWRAIFKPIGPSRVLNS